MADLETVHATIDHTGITGVDGGGGKVVQVVTAVSTTLDTTTSTTVVDSSLSAAITPLFDDSVLLISIDGEIQVAATSGTPLGRSGFVALRNSTDAVVIAQQRRGRNLIAGNAAAAAAYEAIALRGRYTVNSLTARTFKLQFSTAGVDTTATIRGDNTGGVLMTIMETRP